MKILAIRGRNLASLAGDFAVDFTTEPLASAGLFAITGATGSGKSTLLDALCLALYDHTPRLSGIGRGTVPDVGDETLSVSDARALLRRGTGEGHAEVDFVAVDGLAYRSRWTVRRARSKGQGKMQFSSMAFTRLHDGLDVGGSNKTEVLAVIEAKVGLKFAQFTRAVLLAQNEFAAFLKSDDSERAELLEMLTGTERFSQISMRAYQRAKEESDHLNRLNDQLAGQVPLADDVRATLEADLLEAGRKLDALKANQLLLEGYQRWYQALALAITAEREAHTNVEAATRIHDEAIPRRDILQRIESIQPARPLADDCRRLTVERDTAITSERQARDAHTVALGQTQRADETLLQAHQGVTQAEQAKQVATPRLVEARALSAQIATTRPVHATAKLALDDATTAVDQTDIALTEKQKALADTTTHLQTLTTWLAANTRYQLLAEQWPRWDALFVQGTRAATELAQINASLPTLTDAVTKAVGEHHHAAERQAAHERELTQREAALVTAAAGFARHDAAEIAKRRKTLEERREQAGTAADIWRRLSEHEQHRTDLTAKLKTVQIEQADQTRHLTQANADLPGAELSLANATKAFQLAQTAASESVESLRASLEPASPCPVCGSVAHPYAETEPGLRAALTALEENVAAAHQRRDEIRQAGTAAKTALAGLGKTLADIERDLAATNERINATAREWQTSPLMSEAPGEPGDRGSWFIRLTEQLKASLEELASVEKEMHAAMKQRDDAQKSVDAARRDLGVAQTTSLAATQAVQVARSAADTTTNKQQTVAAQLDSLLLQLDAAFEGSDWRADWTADPARYHVSIQTQAVQWQERDAEHNALTAALATLTVETRHLAELRDSAVTRRTVANTRFEEIQQDLIGKQNTLAQIFDGRTADDVEAGLTAALSLAQKTLAAATETANQARVALAGAATTHKQISERCKAASAAMEQAEGTLADWLARRNAGDSTPSIDRATLESLLAHDVSWVIAEREALQTLAMNVGTAAAVYKDRSLARQTHEATRPTGDTTEVVAEQLERIQHEGKDATDHQGMLKALQIQDDQRRIQAAALAGEINAQEARARTWAQLNEMIGSADGRKFRNLAQQMTLDVLLGYANRHLTSLARRYRLERISDTLGLMVVDQDMADEIRTVHSLSGGESFLVSLALALGLASLSSHRVKVESLFIDEGFGSLDADSLRVAMEALDGLQAMGRKVGVISHVQEMTERIGTQIRVARHSEGRSSVSVVV